MTQATAKSVSPAMGNPATIADAPGSAGDARSAAADAAVDTEAAVGTEAATRTLSPTGSTREPRSTSSLKGLEDEVQSELEAVPGRTRLGALAQEILRRRIRSRGQDGSAFGQRHLIRALAEELDPELASVSFDGVKALDILIKRPRNRRQSLVISALVLHAFHQQLSHDSGKQRRSRIERLLREAEWLELNSDYSLFAMVDYALPADAAGEIWQALGATVLANDAATPKARAHNAARMSALVQSNSPAALRACERILRKTNDPVIVSMAQQRHAADAVVEGRGRVREGVLSGPAAGAFFGLSIVRWCLGLIAWVAGLRVRTTMALDGEALRISFATKILGHPVREQTLWIPLGSVNSVATLYRWRSTRLLIGLTAFGVGVIAGSLWVFEGWVGGDTWTIVAGTGIIALSAAIELLLGMIAPAIRKHVNLLVQAKGQRIVLAGVKARAAESFLAALGASDRTRLTSHVRPTKQ